MLSKCSMYTSHERVLQAALGDPGRSSCIVYLEDGTAVVVAMTGLDAQTIGVGAAQRTIVGRSIKEIVKNVRKEVGQRITSIDVQLEVGGENYVETIFGEPENPELIAAAYRTLTARALHGNR